MLNKLTLYLVIAAVNIGEIDVRKMQGKFVKEGGVFEIHDIVVIGLHYKYNTIIFSRKIKVRFFHEQPMTGESGSVARIEIL